MMRMQRGKLWFAAAAISVVGVGASALDMDAIVAAALVHDLAMQRLQLALKNAQLDGQLRNLADGLSLQVGGVPGGAVSFSSDIGAGTSSLAGGASINGTLPDPLATSLSVSVPLSYDIDAAVFDVDVSVAATQPLEPLFTRLVVGAESSADVAGTLALLRAEAAVASRILAVRSELIALLKEIVAQRRAGAAAENRADGLRQEIQTQQLLQQLEPGSYAAARLDADLAAALREVQAAQADLDVAIQEIRERLENSAGSRAGADALAAVSVVDIEPGLAVVFPPATPDSYQPVVEAALELRRSELAVLEQRVAELPDLTLTGSYNITGEVLSASANISLPIIRGSLVAKATQLANAVESAGLALAGARRDYTKDYADLESQLEDFGEDRAAAVREVEIARLRLGETQAAVEAGVSDATAAATALWQLNDSIDAALLTALDGLLLAVDIEALHLSDRLIE
jgi:hypothetical protein